MQFINVPFFRFIILKSMRFFALSTLLFIFGRQASCSGCGEAQVPNQSKICIQPNYIEGCSSYKDKNQCFECEKGYKPNNGVCDALQFGDRNLKLEGCLVKNSQGSACVNCANGYVRRNGVCEVGVKNCAKYGQNNKCKQCKRDYSLTLNQCRFNLLLGCRKIKSDHTCEECYEPFKLKDDHCEVPNCQDLNDYGCVTCMCGFYLDSKRTCQKMEDGCLRYEKGQCIDCLNHYRLKGGSCVIQGCAKYSKNFCTQCKSQYESINGGCQFKNCADWTNDQCFSCKNGYKPQNGVCVAEQTFVCTD